MASKPVLEEHDKAATVCFLPKAGALSLGVALFYALSSLTLALLNKALLSAYSFNGYFFLLASQMGFSLMLCALTRDYLGDPFKIPVYDREVHRSALKMGVLYVANVGAGLIGLQLVNVPMFSCIRRLVSPVILVYEYLSLGKVQSKGIQASVACILCGTLIAGWDTLSADLVGYTILMVNNFLTAASTIEQKQVCERLKLTAFSILYYNAWTALPLSLLLSLATGEFNALQTFEYRFDVTFWSNFAIACAMGPLLTYSSMLSTTYNSPLATSITGNCKDVATTILGAIMFPGFVASSKSVGGLMLSFAGAGGYSYINLKRIMSAKQPASSSSSAAAIEGVGAAAGGGAAAVNPNGKVLTPAVPTSNDSSIVGSGPSGDGTAAIGFLVAPGGGGSGLPLQASSTSAGSSGSVHARVVARALDQPIKSDRTSWHNDGSDGELSLKIEERVPLTAGVGGAGGIARQR